MDLGLAGKRALVLSSSRGLGLGVAQSLAAEGVNVMMTARSGDRLNAAADGINAKGKGRAHAYVADLKDNVEAIHKAATDALGGIDILVANTGGPPAGDDPLGFTREQWEAAYRTLVLSPMTILGRVLPGMRERGWGRVVAVSSSAAREPIATLQLSNAHRPGLIAAFKVLAQRVAADGVTLNSVLPGSIATDRIADAHGSFEAAQAAARDSIPAGRLGTVEEIAAAAVFLCSAPASYITGTTLLVDGGSTASV